MPELQQKLQSGLDDAAIPEGSLPQQLVKMADAWLKGANRLDGPFGTLLGRLRTTLEQLSTTGAVADASASRRAAGGESSQSHDEISPRPPPPAAGLRTVIHDLVVDFVENGEEVATFLAKAEEKSTEWWPDLQKKLKRFPTAIHAIDPKHNGSLKNMEILPVAFGSRYGQVQIDFSRLADDEPESILHDFLQEMKEQVIDLIVTMVDEALTNNGVDTADVSVETLKDSFMRCNLARQLNERFSLKAFFMPKRAPPVDLQNGDVAAWFKKLATKERVSALKDVVLGQPAKNLGELHELIQTGLETTRETWKAQLATKLSTLAVDGFKLLMVDLTSGRKRAGGGLIKQLLRAFLQHIVQTNLMNTNEGLRADLSRFLGDFNRQKNQMHLLWTRLEKQADPEEIGKAAAKHVDWRRLRELVVRQAKRDFTLGKPMQKMPMLTFTGGDKPMWWHPDSLFLSGDKLDADALFTEMLSKYRLGPCKLKKPKYPSSLFHAVAMLAWGKKGLKLVGVSLDEAAAQLRAVCAAQLLSHCAEKQATRDAKVAKLLHEDPASDWKERYIALIKGKYSGDLFCLFFLACHFKLDFCVWRPGAEKTRPTLVAHHTKAAPKEAHHLIVTADPEKADGSGMPIDFSTVTPAEYEAQWWFFVDDRVRKVSFGGENVHILNTTDDEIPRSTDGVEWSASQAAKDAAAAKAAHFAAMRDAVGMRPPSGPSGVKTDSIPRPTGDAARRRPEQPTEEDRLAKKARTTSPIGGLGDGAKP